MFSVTQAQERDIAIAPLPSGMSSTFRDDLLLSYEDADLVQHIRNSPHLSSVSLLSVNFVSKIYQPDVVEDALKAMEIAHQLGLRVPNVKRVVYFEGLVYLIMERVDGVSLEETWTKLGWIGSLRLAMELRRSIRLLRSITSTTAGSPVTGECRSFWLDDLYCLPPRSRPADIASFLTFWVDFTNPRAAMKAAETQLSSSPSKKYVPSTAGPLVFTHHDLAPRNILLDKSGCLWLVDWDLAGWYPCYFEYAAMHNFFIPEHWTWLARIRWNLFTWIAAGRWEKERRVLERIRSKTSRFRAGRRFHLLKRGGPSRRLLD